MECYTQAKIVQLLIMLLTIISISLYYHQDPNLKTEESATRTEVLAAMETNSPIMVEI